MAQVQKRACGRRNLPDLAKMNRINSSERHEASRARLSNGLVNDEGKWLLLSGRGLERKTSPGVKSLARWVATCALLFSPCVPVHADVDFSNYDTPLFQQIVNRIKAKIAARLGEGVNKRDRYFIIPFAYQDRSNKPDFSHCLIWVVRVLADNKQPSFTSGLRKGKFMNRDFEAFTISWLPHDFDKNPHLCVFDGIGSRVDPKKNKCRPSVGRNFRLDETLKLAVNVKNGVCMWGPYEIKKEAFDRGVKRKRLLDGGTIRYIADDRLYRKDGVAINCFHAMAGLEELFPNGGFLGTGWRDVGHQWHRPSSDRIHQVGSCQRDAPRASRLPNETSTDLCTPRSGIAVASTILSRTLPRTTISFLKGWAGGRATRHCVCSKCIVWDTPVGGPRILLSSVVHRQPVYVELDAERIESLA